MSHTTKAMTALSPTPSSDTTISEPQPPSTATNRETFKEAMDSFVTTLHHVDVHLKRQILGLEEAGIIDLSHDTAAAQEGDGDKGDVRPTAVGTVGGLDLGWLNSRGDRVERGMEGELWERGRGFLDGVAREKEGGGKAMEK